MFIGSDSYNIIQTLSQSEGSCTRLVQKEGFNQLYIYKVVDREIPAYPILRRAKIPGIPRIYHARVENGHTEVLEEFLNGKTLEEYIRINGLMDTDQAARIMVQLCRILIALHSAGIIHRDIKPANIILAPDGSVNLIDFDAARRFYAAQESDTVLLGTRGYAAPEQYGYAPTDCRTDIYALGVLINRLTTGRLPGEEILPGCLFPIIRKCTQMDPAFRYENCSQVLAQLLTAQRQQAANPAPTAVFAAPAAPPRKRREWWRLLILGIFTALYAWIDFTENPVHFNTLSLFCLHFLIFAPVLCYVVDLFRLRTVPPLPFMRSPAMRPVFGVLYFVLWFILLIIVSIARSGVFFS